MTITRAEVLNRARTRWGGINSVPYSQNTLTRTGYRADCSGLACDALGIPPNALGSWGGLNTVTLVSSGYVSRIDPNDLKPGDLVGNMGPGTGGDAGHVQIFTDWLNNDDADSRYRCIEQRGGASGPRDRDRVYDMAANGYRAYRYRDIVDDTQGVDDMSAKAEEAIGQILAKLTWIDPRVEALAHGYETVRFGPEKGAPVEAVQRIKALETHQAGAPTQEQVDAAVLKAMQNPDVLKGIGDAIASHLHVS